MSYTFIEDLFVDFYEALDASSYFLQHQDRDASKSFYSLLKNGQSLTRAQSNYILRILDKYKSHILKLNLDASVLDNPRWKQPFRIIDTTKNVYIEHFKNKIWVCVKQPFTLKEPFEKACLKQRLSSFNNIWDATEKVRKYDFYILNPILAKDFFLSNNHSVDQEFLDLVDQLEYIWNNQYQYYRFCSIESGNLRLINASESAERYFEENKTGNNFDNLLLAKHMGFTVLTDESIPLVSGDSNKFWIKHYDRLFKYLAQSDSRVCVLVPADNAKKHVERLVSEAERYRTNIDDLKVCFRSNSSDDPEFNAWIKNKGLGGDLSSAKILVFKEKPAKWLIEEDKDVKIIVLTGPFMPSSAMVQTWIKSKPCIIYAGELRPSITKEQKIVDL